MKIKDHLKGTLVFVLVADVGYVFFIGLRFLIVDRIFYEMKMLSV